MKNKNFFLLIIIIFTFFFSSCDLFDTNEKTYAEPGTGIVKVEGYINKSFNGEAVFNHVPTGRGDYLFFIVVRKVDDPGIKYQILEINGIPNPEPGNYVISDSVYQNKFIFNYSDSDFPGTFKISDGNIVVEWSSSELIRATFDIKGFGFIHNKDGSTEKVEIKISGIFNAVKGNVGIIIN